MHLRLPDLGHVADVAEPIARFGAEGGLEVATRASRSRDIGNHLHFCRWPQVGRLVEVIASPAALGTVH